MDGLAQKLRDLASDPSNRAHMIPASESLPTGVMMFLDHEDATVVFAAVETVYLLSLYPPNRSKMMADQKLMPKLKSLMSKGKTTEIKRKAIAAFTSLKKVNQQKKASNKSKRNSLKAPLSTRNQNTFSVGFGGGTKKKKKTVATTTLYLRELNCDENKQIFNNAAVKIRGIISFWVELSCQKTVIRTSLSEETLISEINKKLGWNGSTEREFVSNEGYVQDVDVGEGALVLGGGKKKKGQNGNGWWGSVSSYIW